MSLPWLLGLVFVAGIVIGAILRGRRSDGVVSVYRQSGNDTPLPADAGDRIRQLILANHKIEAIKLYRETRGVGLKEAKDAVEALERDIRG